MNSMVWRTPPGRRGISESCLDSWDLSHGGVVGCKRYVRRGNADDVGVLRYVRMYTIETGAKFAAKLTY